jgi:hypothetical protein
MPTVRTQRSWDSWRGCLSTISRPRTSPSKTMGRPTVLTTRMMRLRLPWTISARTMTRTTFMQHVLYTDTMRRHVTCISRVCRQCAAVVLRSLWHDALTVVPTYIYKALRGSRHITSCILQAVSQAPELHDLGRAQRAVCSQHLHVPVQCLKTLRGSPTPLRGKRHIIYAQSRVLKMPRNCSRSPLFNF